MYLREKDYIVQLPSQIRRGTVIVLGHKVVTFLEYLQCKGAGNHTFGTYGKMKVADLSKDKIEQIDAYEFSPIICLRHTTDYDN